MKDSAKPDNVEVAGEAGSDPGQPPAHEARLDLEGAFADDGVDLTLIRWMLELSPTERLQAAQNMIDVAWLLRTDGET